MPRCKEQLRTPRRRITLPYVPLRDSMFFRHFAFEKNASLPWRSRLRRAGAYSAVIWVIMIVGIVVLKYGFDLIDRPLGTLLAGSFLLSAILFLCVIYAYREADSTKRLYDDMDQRRERK
jgi:hypothetical protein